MWFPVAKLPLPAKKFSCLSAPLKCGPKLANILHALQSKYFLDEGRATCSAEDRCYKLTRFRDDFVAGHGIFGRATDVPDPPAQLRAVGKCHLDDGLTPGAAGIYPGIGDHLYLGPLAQNSGVLHAGFVMD
jgi:hypothetical protein